MRQLLLTGATGLIGAEVLEQLERRGDHAVTCVARRPVQGATVVPWDLSAEEPPAALRRRWDAIVHCAADTRWSQTADEARRANVATVEAVAALATPETHVVHVSTAAVVGPGSDGTSLRQDDYRNMYEWSKACAEDAARRSIERLTIVRPPLVVGRRRDGHAVRFAGLYVLLRGITTSSVPAVVADPDAYFDAVPVDDVAAAILGALDAPAGETVTPAGGDRAPRVARVVHLLCDALNTWRVAHGVDPVDVPPFIDPESWHRFYRPFSDDILTRRQALTLDHLDHFIPYMAITEPWVATHPVLDADEAIAPSVRYWADTHPRLAALTARPWSVRTA